MLLSIVSCLLVASANVFAIQVSPGSTCAAVCLDNPESDPLDPASSITTVSDITCEDQDYQTSSKAIKFKNCLECLQNSRNVHGDENDAAWFLYNLRYSVDVCVYGFPNATKSVSSPCDIDHACQPLKLALEADSLDPAKATEFSYCTADGGKFSGARVDACIQCFSSSSNQAYMANFVTALKAGCQQRPQPGQLIGLSGSPFGELLVNITTPPKNETGLANSTNATAMTTGAIVGIAVGASLLFLGGTALFWVYYRRQRRLDMNDLGSHYDPRTGSKSVSPPLGGGFNTADNHEHSLLSDYELKAQQAYVDNADYYDTVEKQMRTRRPRYTLDPNKPGSGPTGALPTHPAYVVPRNPSRTSSREPSPNPPNPARSNQPDAYALTAYLNAAEAALALPGPPPGPPPPVHSRHPSAPRGTLSQQRDPNHSRSASTESNHAIHPQFAPLPPPPPPPSRRPKIPSLALPSVPRIRVPKKYAPPRILIEGATPVADKGEVPIGIEISRPVIAHDKRFVEDPFEPSRAASSQAAAQPIIEHKVIDRRPRRVVEEVALGTGKSALYG